MHVGWNQWWTKYSSFSLSTRTIDRMVMTKLKVKNKGKKIKRRECIYCLNWLGVNFMGWPGSIRHRAASRQVRRQHRGWRKKNFVMHVSVESCNDARAYMLRDTLSLVPYHQSTANRYWKPSHYGWARASRRIRTQPEFRFTRCGSWGITRSRASLVAVGGIKPEGGRRKVMWRRTWISLGELVPC